MRTNIDIDEDLIAAVMQATGTRTKKAAVEEALRRTLRFAEQRKAWENMQGLGWEGDLDALRNDLPRTIDPP